MNNNFSDDFIMAVDHTIRAMGLDSLEKIEAYFYLAIATSICVYGSRGGLKYLKSTFFVKFPFYDPVNGNYLRFDTRLRQQTRDDLIHQIIINFNKNQNKGDIQN